ncbi:MAG: hypothetical protein IID46_15285 [Planctomycetes bacterium]|nr:hypothetical protein [Planctomycetota bacterium]
MVHSSLTLQEFFNSVYLRHHWLKDNSTKQIAVTLNLFDDWHGSPVLVASLSADLVLDFLRFRHRTKSARTVNNNRAAIKAVWSFAHRKGHCSTPVPDSTDIPKLPEIKRLPTSWSIEELGRIIEACKSVRPLDGFDCRHWKALILVSFDTAHRLASLLAAKREDVSSLGFLIVRETKQKRETVHKLHADTLKAIEELPRTPLLFPWPLCEHAIHDELKSLLRSANLPATRRDLFQKLRRTSATHLAAVCGESAAERHLDHRTPGLASRSYIDRRFMPQIHAADVLPRP